MKNLIPQILCSDIVHRYDIWINTTNEDDINFFKYLEKKFEKINLIYQPDGNVNGNKSINAFFKTSISEDEIYVRLDDDIMWIIPGFFNKIYQKRIEDNESFLISPLVVNNSISTHLFQQNNKLQYGSYLPAICMDELTWKNPHFAYDLHLWFLNHLENNTYNSLLTDDYIIALNRFSINSISWHGSEFKKFEAVVLGDEEEYLTVIKPAELKKFNKIIGSILVAHYSFFPQRDFLDSTDLLTKYEIAVRKTYQDNILAKNIFNIIDDYFKDEIINVEKKQKYSYSKLKNFLSKIKIPVITLKKLSDLK